MGDGWKSRQKLSKSLIGGKTRRGYGKKNRKKIGNGKKRVEFTLLGSNANGLRAKKESLQTNINYFQPSVITIQETKLRKAGTFKLKGYQIFEKLRCGFGGGLLTAVDDNLLPVLISTGKTETSEILVVQICTEKHNIRIINAYGPQEDPSNKEKIYEFWQELEQEIASAKEENCLLVIELDANAKLGKETILDDPHEMSDNGKLLLDILTRQNLTVVNGMDMCEGVITRERVTKDRVERAVIDFVIVCAEMKEFVKSMLVDEKRIHVLTKYASKRGIQKHKTSDHNILVSRFSIHSEAKPRTVRSEFFQMKDLDDQRNFFQDTDSTGKLSSSFDTTRSFPHNCNIFFKNLKSCIHKNFKKIRIKKGGTLPKLGENPVQEKLERKIKLKLYLKKSSCEVGLVRARAELEEVENFLSETCAGRNASMIKSHLKSMENLDGNFCQLNLWKLKKKVSPPKIDPPMGKKDEAGTLVTAPNLLKQLYLRTYQTRLKHREMKPDLMDIYFLKEELWSRRLEELKTKKSKPWNLGELETALKSLKNNKTADPNKMINEIFKAGCAGSDLLESLLLLNNGIKDNFHIPEYVLLENITTVYKNKGSRFDMNNDRGIFILTVFKKILDKLIFFDNIEDIDGNMSDSNIGARRNRNIKNHLFIIYGVINSVIKGKEECIDIQIYDLEKAFDALWLTECLNDLFDTLSEDHRDDKIALLYASNKDNHVAVNTAVGMTERINIPQIVQQGGTWGPVLCSNTVDTIGKKCRDRGELHYLYKKTVRVLPLAMVDDLNAISKCGLDSIELNTFINTQIEMKKLRFHVPDKNGKSKCHKLHIGNNHETCPILKVHNTVIESVTEDTYLGDIISSDGKNSKNVADRISKGNGKITQIEKLLEEIALGEHFMEIAILFRETMFVNGILTNAEIWYSFSESEIKEFESLDRLLLRKILQVPVSTPEEAFYLELGILPIGVIVKARRINYLHYLLTRDTDEMLYKFFITQWLQPCRGDWTETVKQDLQDFNIQCDFPYIKSKSGEAFKRIVKSKAHEYSLNELTKNQQKHSKMEGLYYTEVKPQKYLTMKDVRIDQVRNIFRYRTRMADFGENFRGNQDHKMCPLCFKHYDSQSLSFQCEFYKDKMEININMSDIYRDEISMETVKTMCKMMKLRKKHLMED